MENNELLAKATILLDEDLTKVSGGVSDEEMAVVSRIVQEVNNLYQEWIMKNISASETEKVYQYQVIFKNVYDGLSENERMIIIKYIEEFSR